MHKLYNSFLNVQFVCLLWMKLLIQVKAYWYQQSVATGLLRRNRPLESKFGWYFSKHFLYKTICRRIINPTVFSFTVNFPRLICRCWTGTGAVYEMANERKEDGILDHPITLFSGELWKLQLQLVQGRYKGFCLLHLDTPQQLLPVQLMMEREDPQAHLHLLLMVHPHQLVSLYSMWLGGNVRRLLQMPWVYGCVRSGANWSHLPNLKSQGLSLAPMHPNSFFFTIPCLEILWYCRGS